MTPPISLTHMLWDVRSLIRSWWCSPNLGAKSVLRILTAILSSSEFMRPFRRRSEFYAASDCSSVVAEEFPPPRQSPRHLLLVYRHSEYGRRHKSFVVRSVAWILPASRRLEGTEEAPRPHLGKGPRLWSARVVALCVAVVLGHDVVCSDGRRVVEVPAMGTRGESMASLVERGSSGLNRGEMRGHGSWTRGRCCPLSARVMSV